jgi:hypothetical protein
MLNKSANISTTRQMSDVTPVDLYLNVVKPLGAQWMIQLYDYLKSKPDIVQNGFRAAGILDCITS